jgi:flagellar motility protein MotE (MotC chaperone)
MTPGKIFAGRGTLAILALLMAASGALRLGDGIGAAMALQANALDEVSREPLQCPEPPAALAAALKERDETVMAREAAINDRMAALALAEEAITSRLGELETAETKLRETLAIADGAAENDLARLTVVYEAMKPAEAATLFETMAPEFAAGFLGRMRPEAAAAILTGMKPENAYTISVLIAGRNALAPKE